jgi:glutamate-5-semialdehyde dehydrogenase
MAETADVIRDMEHVASRAVTASRAMVLLGTRAKNRILCGMADEIERRGENILAANGEDMGAARAAGLSGAILDRLLLTAARVDGMVKGIRAVAELKDPVGRQLSRKVRPNGLVIVKKRVPIGVIAIIYEARPNVTADSAALCVKTSNAVILRGGSEAFRSSVAIADAMIAGGERAGMPAGAVQLVRTTEHSAVTALLQMEGRVDLVIPRGGESLIRAVVQQARVPVVKQYKGVCHVFVDESADLDAALRIVENAKCQRPAVCNAMECLLVHANVAARFLPQLAARCEKLGVRLKADEGARRFLPAAAPVSEGDWNTEYLDLIMNVGVVRSTEEAIAHINRYGTRHSDAIVTGSEASKKCFVEQVDSSCVYVNASTRFTDGGEFGMGAEIGISTDKLHARGPMGLEELTTYKYIIRGSGQVRG